MGHLDHLLDDGITMPAPIEKDLDAVTVSADVFTDLEPTNTDPVTEPEVDTQQGENDLVTSFLKGHGIVDPSKIQFENDQGEIEDIDFNSLSRDEQLTIINELTDNGLSEHETEVVNYLRQNKATFNEVIDYFAEQRLKEYLEANPDAVKQKTYQIDDYTDDELYLADLKSKYPSFTDEELLTKLNSAKTEEELFQKEVEALRTDYKNQEEKMLQEAELAEKQQYEDLQNNLIEAIGKFNELPLDSEDLESDSLVIEDADKHQMLAYLLSQDADGKSLLVKDLEDPAALIELAWYRNFGRNVIDGISQYWKNTLKEERKKIADLEKQIAGQTKTIVTQKEDKQNSPSKGLNWGDLI